MRTFNELFRRSQHKVKNYRNDFVYDFKSIKKYPGTPYIHATREHGTAMILLHSAGKLLKECKNIQPEAERKKQIENHLNWPKVCGRHYLENAHNSNMVHHFDGKKLRKVTREKAIEIIREHLMKTRQEITRIENASQVAA